ncbi:MAG: choice-of-anchor D domain-containing protein [Myxococcota bacterium]
MTSKALLLLPLLALGCSKGGDAGCPTGTQATANGLCRAICQHDDDCLLGEHCAVNVCVAGAPTDAGVTSDGGQSGGAVLSEQSIDFGKLLPGASATRSFHVENPTAASVQVQVDLGASTPGFSVSTDAHFPASLGPGERIDFQVRFDAPAAPGRAEATLQMSLCAQGCIASLSLRGASTTEVLSCSGSTLDFGAVVLGEGAAKALACTNQSSAAVEVRALDITQGRGVFVVLDMSAPGVVQPGASFSVNMRFDPAGAGRATGQLDIGLTQDGAQATSSVTLVGDTTGPQPLRCSDVDFGAVSVGNAAIQQVNCTAEIAAINITGAALASPSSDLTFNPIGVGGGAITLPFTLHQNETMHFVVSWRPSAAGSLSNALNVTTDVPSAQPSVSLRGTATPPPACALTVPTNFDFGLNPPGFVHDAMVPIANLSVVGCQIQVMNPAHPAFSVQGTRSFVLAPGQRALVAVRATADPRGQTLFGSLNVTASGGSSYNIGLSISAGTPDLLVRPFPNMAFGPVQLGCAVENRRGYEVVSLSGTPAHYTAATEGDPDFSTFNPGGMLSSYQAERRTLGFLPQSMDSRVGRLRFNVGAQTIYVELSGEGRNAVGTVTATIPARPATAPTDILLAVDGGAEAASLRAAFLGAVGGWLAELNSTGEEYRVGLVGAGGGALLMEVDNHTPDAADLLSQAFQSLPTNTPFTPLADVARFTTDANVIGVPPVFLRPEAQLAVVIVGLRDDVSPGLVDVLLGKLRGRPLGRPGALRVHAIAGGEVGCQGSVAYPPTPRLVVAARKTGGQEVSACATMTGIPPASVFLSPVLDVLELPSQPAPGTVVVRAGGNAVPPGDYAIEYPLNRLSFVSIRAPAASARILARYTPRCDPPLATCGDGTVSQVEQCDDRNTIDTDGCTASCFRAQCGDGIVQAGVEACDDGNLEDGDGCTTRCLPTASGWLVTQTPASPVDPAAVHAGRMLGDDSVVPEPPSFPFRFYGRDVANAYVSTNGFIAFVDPGGNSFPNSRPLSNANPPNGLIAWWWDDLTAPMDAGVNGYAFANYVSGGEAIASFLFDLRHGVLNGASLTSEVRLHANTFDVEVIYRDLNMNFGALNFSATPGVKSLDGSRFQSYLNCVSGCSSANWPTQTAFRLTPQ